MFLGSAVSVKGEDDAKAFRNKVSTTVSKGKLRQSNEVLMRFASNKHDDEKPFLFPTCSC